MKRTLSIGVVGLVLLFGLAQVVPVKRTNPPAQSEVAAPPAIKNLLRGACYDCHSNETVWPWYSRIAPVSWLVVHDVTEGRQKLNFSTWGAYGVAPQAKMLKEAADEVNEGEMPPWSYRLMHRAARLSQSQRDVLRAWAAAERVRLGP